jgi:hypothetical protein
MNVTVFGPTGQIGQLVRDLLAGGHHQGSRNIGSVDLDQRRFMA